MSAGVDPFVRTEITRLQNALGHAYDRRTMNKFIKVAELNAARSLVKPIRSAVPRHTGRLSKAVAARSGRYRRPSAVVGPRQRGPRGAFYARYALRTGAGSHRIPKATGKLVRLATQHGVFAAVRHPGMRANPVVRRVAEENLAETRLVFARTVTKLINEQEFRGKVVGLQAKYAGRTKP